MARNTAGSTVSQTTVGRHTVVSQADMCTHVLQLREDAECIVHVPTQVHLLQFYASFLIHFIISIHISTDLHIHLDATLTSSIDPATIFINCSLGVH